jgi:hypothetical protein
MTGNVVGSGHNLVRDSGRYRALRIRGNSAAEPRAWRRAGWGWGGRGHAVNRIFLEAVLLRAEFAQQTVRHSRRR